VLCWCKKSGACMRTHIMRSRWLTRVRNSGGMSCVSHALLSAAMHAAAMARTWCTPWRTHAHSAGSKGSRVGARLASRCGPTRRKTCVCVCTRKFGLGAFLAAHTHTYAHTHTHTHMVDEGLYLRASSRQVLRCDPCDLIHPGLAATCLGRAHVVRALHVLMRPVCSGTAGSQVLRVLRCCVNSSAARAKVLHVLRHWVCSGIGCAHALHVLRHCVKSSAARA